MARIPIISVLAVLCLTSVFATACGEPPPTQMESRSPSAPPFSQQDIEDWIRFRLIYGLRADADWVIRVASDPTATSEPFDVPLLPSELDAVHAANVSAQSLTPAVRRYAAEFPEFAGLWLELPRVVVAFTGRIPEHESEAEVLFGDQVVVRAARYTLTELRGFADAVEAERDWLSTVGVTVIDIGLDEMANAVNLQFRSGTQAAEAVIRERFGQPDWLRLDWAGPPRWTGPYGDIELRVIDGEGRPVPVTIVFRALDPRVGEYGPAEEEDGIFIDKGIAAVDWVVDITYVDSGEAKTITREFTVRADELLKVNVVVGR